MRELANCLWITVSLLVCGAGCIPTAATGARQIQIAVDPVAKCRIDQGELVRLAALPTVLQQRKRQIKQSQAAPAEFTIRIRVDDAAPYSDFMQVVDACRESGFFKFELVVAEFVFPFDLTPPGPSGVPDDLQLPPMILRLQANEAGALSGMKLNDRPVADVEQLRLELIGVLGDDRGPGSIQDACELELDCDDNLRFRHLAEAYLAVSGYESDNGSRVALVKTIWPLTGSQPHDVLEVEEFEVLEDLIPLSELIEAETERQQRSPNEVK